MKGGILVFCEVKGNQAKGYLPAGWHKGRGTRTPDFYRDNLPPIRRTTAYSVKRTVFQFVWPVMQVGSAGRKRYVPPPRYGLSGRRRKMQRPKRRTPACGGQVKPTHSLWANASSEIMRMRTQILKRNTEFPPIRSGSTVRWWLIPKWNEEGWPEHGRYVTSEW
jgi:hypothetical protein